jgi:hypothetical protein
MFGQADAEETYKAQFCNSIPRNKCLPELQRTYKQEEESLQVRTGYRLEGR